MKIRLYKKQVIRLCIWYAEQIILNYPQLRNCLITPSTKLQIERALENIQQKQMQIEPQNSIWNIKVKPVFHDERHSFDIDVADYSNVLILDFDNPNSY